MLESPEAILNTGVVARLTNERFHLILFATESCNFRCVYCYEDFALGKMSALVVSGVKGLLDKRMPNLRHLKVSWFGGEPLLAFNVIKSIHDHIRSHHCFPNLIDGFYSDITTNGFLLDSEMFRQLVGMGVQFFQISLDGDEDAHNSTRLTKAKNQGSFKRIYTNLLAMKSTDLSFDDDIRIHITKDNLKSVEALTKRIAADFGHDKRFKLHFKPVNHLGGPNDSTVQILNAVERREVPMALAARFPFPDMIYDLSGSEPYICYAAAANSLAVRSDGAIAKCTVALNDGFNKLGSLSADGSVQVDDIKYQRWISALLSGDGSVQSCPVHFVRRKAESVSD
jgi:uncharacterized protein